MDEDVHFIPVGFDYGRLLQPISAEGGLPADRVVLLYSAEGTDDQRAEELVETIVDGLENVFEIALRREVVRMPVEVDIFDYTDVFELAYNLIVGELNEGNRVYVNISSMPRTVAFAFATAAESIVIESPEYRSSVTTYYSSPDEYLVIDMKEQLELEMDFLEKLLSGESSESRIEERYEAIKQIVDEIENGFSKGVKKLNGNLFAEIPAPPKAELRYIEQRILFFLEEEGDQSSTTQLAKNMADFYADEYNESYRSKVQYNVKGLVEKGYLLRDEEGNSYRTELSQMGNLWAITHELPSE